MGQPATSPQRKNRSPESCDQDRESESLNGLGAACSLAGSSCFTPLGGLIHLIGRTTYNPGPVTSSVKSATSPWLSRTTAAKLLARARDIAPALQCCDSACCRFVHASADVD